MTEPGSPHDFVYVHTDIPEGMTIREWRARKGEVGAPKGYVAAAGA